jgi:hypothetical protein
MLPCRNLRKRWKDLLFESSRIRYFGHCSGAASFRNDSVMKVMMKILWVHFQLLVSCECVDLMWTILCTCVQLLSVISPVDDASA